MSLQQTKHMFGYRPNNLRLPASVNTIQDSGQTFVLMSFSTSSTFENQNVTFRVSSTGSNPKRCRCKHEPVQMVKWTCKLMKGMADAIQLSKPRRHILLTGQPGVGKTTLVKKVCDRLEEQNFECQGFYTEELREDGQRVGFDVVTLDGKRAPLARIVDRDSPVTGRSYMVGRYNVQLQSFEQAALPALVIKPEECTRVLVIDEIGKMELFSRSFTQTVRDLLKHSKTTVFATIPIKANPFVEEIRHRDDVIVYTVTKENRYSLIKEVADAVKDSLEYFGT